MVKELKTYDTGEFEIEIVDIYEEANQLRIKTRCPYGEDNIGLSLKSKYLDRTGIPRWRTQLKDMLKKKYGTVDKSGKSDAAKKEVYTDYRGIINTNDLNNPIKNPK